MIASLHRSKRSAWVSYCRPCAPWSSDVRAYNTEEGHKEHALDLIAGLDDLAGTVRDFVSQFPRSREIVANQVALELVEDAEGTERRDTGKRKPRCRCRVPSGTYRPQRPGGVGGPEESAEGARTTADRAKLVGLRLLTAANFGTHRCSNTRSGSSVVE